ncbi:mechanosensitive ion channel family protein [Loktanella sp. R86503]|uniref:mechanosensitive ion channel family protein n=1 Tax=Loktanella sp. R86503 TaxID=3093847 RepID=UPI0036DBBD6A
MFRIASLFLIFALTVSIGVPGSSFAQDAVFEEDAMNVGLSDVSDSVDRSSPRGTMEALIDLAEVRDFDQAAHLLDLSNIPKERQREDGPALAAALFEVIDRNVVINWADLIDRPDGMDANATTNSAVAGQTRRSILLWVLTIDDRPYPMRLDRIKAGDAEPVWVFSARTVSNIAKLHDHLGPSEMEQSLPSWARQDAFWNLMWWEVIGLPVMLLLSALGGVLTYKGLSRVAYQADRDFMTRIVRSTRMPAVIFVTTSIIATFRSIFVFSGVISAVITPLLALGYVLSILILVVNVVDRIIDHLVQFDDDDLKSVNQDERRAMATKIALARRILIVIIFVVGAGIVLTEANMFRTFGFSLLASAGAMTIILGFAAREILSNIMSSMQIAINQSARIGDKVLYKDHICHVERINFTYVQLRDWTGVRLIVPVTEFVAEAFENWTLKEAKMKRLIAIRVKHRTDVSKLRDIFFDVIKEMDANELGTEDEHMVVVTDHDVFGQEVTFGLSCADPNTSFMVECDLRERLINRLQDLEAAGEDIFPNTAAAESA